MIQRESALLLQRGQVAGTGTRAARAPPRRLARQRTSLAGTGCGARSGGAGNRATWGAKGQRSGERLRGSAMAWGTAAVVPRTAETSALEASRGEAAEGVASPCTPCLRPSQGQAGGSQACFPGLVGRPELPVSRPLQGSCLSSSVCQAGTPFDSRATVRRQPGRALGSRVLHLADPRGRHRDSLPGTAALRSPSGGPNHTGAWAMQDSTGAESPWARKEAHVGYCAAISRACG